MTVVQAVNNLKERFSSAGIDTAALDAQLIVGNAMGMSRVQILTYPEKILTENEKCKINEMFLKRINRMPMQYILGVCEFMGLDFKVNSDTLIPRGDTEILVEKAIEMINKNGYKSVLDIGTGSGAIAVSVAKYTAAKVTAADISNKAISVAKRNAADNGVSVEFINSDLFSNINKKYDLILSNPPYIEKDIIKTLEPDVKDYEPMLALDGGIDGLDFYKRITKDCCKYLNENGSIAFEIGYNQSEAVSSLLGAYDFDRISVEKDLAGFDRVVIGHNLYCCCI
ncbi:MAG: peptide chain release factor N(5)-glutamine methyltransferase [Clostridia bacterium]|nr:peptide chain release factor N(5)-glutamine methyltransferase [Clostridia bacterium]